MKRDSICVSSSVSVCILVLAVIIVYYIPSPIHPLPYIYNHSLPRLEGPLKVNTALHGVKKLFENQLLGPESFTCDKHGYVYTGTSDGKLWRFKDNNLEFLVNVGINHTNCGSFELEPQCGRAKGMKIDQDGNLIFVDAYKGLLKLNLETRQLTVLVSPDTDQLKQPLKFLNGLALTSDGTIYFTDSSTKWDRRNYRYEVIETNRYGRLLKYSPITDKLEVLLDGLYLANGLVIAPDQKHLLIAEMSVSRITKYYIAGKLEGQSEIFIDNLPGYPDNIQLNSRGNYFVGLGSAKFQGSSRMGPFLDIIGPYPGFKRLLTKITPLPVFDIFLPLHTILLEINHRGEIVASYHDPTGHVMRGVGEAYECEGQVYLGHFSQAFVGNIGFDNLKIINTIK